MFGLKMCASRTSEYFTKVPCKAKPCSNTSSEGIARIRRIRLNPNTIPVVKIVSAQSNNTRSPAKNDAVAEITPEEASKLGRVRRLSRIGRE